MAYEWEEEVPQPKPPTNKRALCVQEFTVEGKVSGVRDATQADVARALGVTEAQLETFLRNPVMQPLPGLNPMGAAASLQSGQLAVNTRR